MRELYEQMRHVKYLAFLSGEKNVSTATLSREFGVSQQTASRVLRELEGESLITREMNHNGQAVRVTPKGRELLRDARLFIDSALSEPPEKITFTGKVTSGSGEGAYYMKQQGYLYQFRNALGCVPFPGTLNLQLSPREARKRDFLNSITPIFISGFRTDEREFGVLRCFRCSVGGIDGYVILPERAHHEPEFLEVISEEELKKALSLKDGDKVGVEVWQN